MNKKTEPQGAGGPGEQQGEGQALLEKIID